MIAISVPHLDLSSSRVNAVRSIFSNMTDPDFLAVLIVSSPMVARESTVFPEPDSPTIPRLSPGFNSNETSFTACNSPRAVANLTSRFFTLRKSLTALTPGYLGAGGVRLQLGCMR